MVGEHQISLPHSLIVVDGIIHRGRSTVYSGTCQDQEKTKVAIKFAATDTLLMEAGVYDELADIQGTVIPKLYGLFFGETDKGKETACIIMQYAGEELEELLEDLPKPDQSVYPISTRQATSNTAVDVYRGEILSHLAAVHACGLHLPDFAERNILKADNGSYRLIDFEDVKDHDCRWTLDFRNPGEYDTFDVDQRMGCGILWNIASDMQFWNTRMSSRISPT